MVGERDIVGISVPFAAGIAAGAVLCARLDIRSAVPADCVLIFLAILLFLAVRFDRLSDRIGRLVSLSKYHNLPKRLVSLSNHRPTPRFDGLSDRQNQRILFGGIFLVTGIFCALNQHIVGGIPEYTAGPVAQAASRAAGRLKSVIEGIPYPSQTTGALVKALLTGDRSGLTKEITGIFRDSGASHILALSGLHLGVLYLILTKLTSPLGNSLTARRIRSPLIICAALFYSIMTGSAPSIIRAFLFITINETVKLLGRRRKPVNVLLAALTIQLAVKPDVIGSVGFQLSYLAMAGIFILYPRLEGIYPSPGSGRLSRFNPFRRIWNAAALSVSCQVFTGPLAWHYFRTFPKYFILTNLIALPLTSAVIALSVATIALSFFGICPDFLVNLNDQAVEILVFCLKVIAGMDD